MDVLKKAKLFLLEPSKAFDTEKTTSMESAFVYMLKLLVVMAVLSAVVTGISNVWLGLVTLVVGYISGLIGNVIGGLWLHIWAYIFGAKKGLNQTLKTVFYGGTPMYLLGWIPFISVVSAIWSLVLNWIGLTKLHGLTGGQSALAVIVAIIIPLIVIGALFVLMAGLMLATFGGFLTV